MSIEAFGKKLKELRELKKWTQAELGEKLDLTLKQIQRYEHGKVLPDYDKMQTLKKLFKYDFYSLLCDSNNLSEGDIGSNLKVIRENTEMIINTQKAGNHVILDSLARLERKPAGTLSALADTLAQELDARVKSFRRGSQSGVGM